MLEEEAQHLPRSVRPSRIGVGAGGAASRPGMSGTMDHPVLKDCPPARVGMDRAGIGMASRHPTAMHFLLQARRPLLRNDMIAVARMHCVVPIPMKNDGRDSRPTLQHRRNVAGPRRSRQVTVPQVTFPHGAERRWEVVGGPPCEPGMHADRRIQIRVGRTHDGGRGCSCRQAPNVNSPRIDANTRA